MTARFLSVVAFLSMWLVSTTVSAQMAYLKGTQPNGDLGYSVADAGDVNNDGFADLLVGAPSDDTQGLDVGRAFLWFGGPGLSVAPDLVFDDGTGASPQFGYAVAGIGDVNNDGFDDVAIGAPTADTGGADAGAVYIYFGGASMNDVVDRTLTGETGDDEFGSSISRAGDMNGDTYDDWLVGAPFADPAAGTDAGAAYLFLGANGTPDTTFDVRFEGELANANFGASVADVTGFRTANEAAVLVGSPGYAGSTGRAYLFFGAAGLPDATADVTFTNNIAGEEFGYAVSRAGEFDNDSLVDIAIGAPGATGDRGFVRLYYGDASPAAQPSSDLEIDGETGGDRFGAAVADIGNFTGAGPDDLAVGAPTRDGGASDSGHVYVFAGGASYTSASQGQDVSADNPVSSPADDAFGTSVSALDSDLDGDGDPDFLIGAPGGNNAAATVTGIGVVMGSGLGVTPVAEIPFAASRDDDQWTMRFGGIAALASSADVWTVEASSRRVARLGDNLGLVGNELVARIPAVELQNVDEVELRYTVDDVELAAQFAVPGLSLAELVLSPPYPNPFNPTTRIGLRVPVGESFELRIVDVRGRLVRVLDQGVGEGLHRELVFDGRDARGRPLASGSYRAVLVTDTRTRTESLVLMK